MFKILTVNPGSTSTKIGVFEDDRCVLEKNILFPDSERKKYARIREQLDNRFNSISAALREAGFSLSEFDAVSGRGGLFAGVRSGTYLINNIMIKDAEEALRGEHASNLGCMLARKIAAFSACPAFIVDPVSVNELTAVAKISGAPEIERGSLVHALNQRSVARKVAAGQGKKYEECKFVVAHLGSGVTIGVHSGGRIIDVVGAKSDGPFSPERAGGLPADKLIEFCFSGLYTKDELLVKLLSGWGFISYLGTRDLREVLKMAESDKKARLIYEAFVYQVAKGIGELATVVNGCLDAVVITGGMAYSEKLCHDLCEKIAFIGRIEIVPGEDEQAALALGALRVLEGTEPALRYPSDNEHNC